MPTSLIGALGFGRQSAKDTVATAFQFIPATSLGLNLNQSVQTLPPEVGGDYFLRGSYKASVSGGGDCALVVRPNSIGSVLYGQAGQDTVTGVVGQTGAYQHVFQPFLPAAGVDLPWFTAVKDVVKIFAEQYLNSKVAALSFSIPKSAIATSTVSLFTTTPSAISVPATETFDSSPPFQTCLGTIALNGEISGVPISATSNKMENISVQFGNNLSQDEFSVGNFYADNSTLLQRTVSVSMDFIIRDSGLYQAVYLNGGTIPGAWSPTILRGALSATLTSGTNVPGTTQPYSLAFTFPGLDFNMIPITLSGADLVRATLSTQVTLGPSGSDRYTVTLINGIPSY